MNAKCASFVENPAVRCPNPPKLDSVFCDFHSRQHLAKYLKYKKLEANLNPIRDNQTKEYYLKAYSRFSQAHQVRFIFREKAIAYSARDIGHQIRIDWLWDQVTLCVQHLGRLFALTGTQTVGKASPVKPIVTQKERIESRKAFKTYTATKKKIEDYEALIEQALESDDRVVQLQLQEYQDNLDKLLGSSSRDIRWTVDLGKLMSIYSGMVDPKQDYSTQPQIIATPFGTPYDNTHKLNYAKLGYEFMLGPYQEKMALMKESPVLHPESLSPKDDLEVQEYVKNFNFMTEVIEKIVANGMVIYFSPKLLRLFYNFTFAYFITGQNVFPVEVDRSMKQLQPFKRHIPGMIFTPEQLSQFEGTSFIQNDGNVEQLLAWRQENLQNNPNEPLSSTRRDLPELLPEYLEAVIITEYYTQALSQEIARSWSLPSDDFFPILDRIGRDMDILTNHFAFPEMVELFQRYRSSGIFRRDIAETNIIQII